MTEEREEREGMKEIHLRKGEGVIINGVVHKAPEDGYYRVPESSPIIERSDDE